MNVFYTVSICCEVSSHWSVFVLVFLADIASSTIKSFVEFFICFTCVLFLTSFACDEIYDVSCFACNVLSNVVCSFCD